MNHNPNNATLIGQAFGVNQNISFFDRLSSAYSSCANGRYVRPDAVVAGTEDNFPMATAKFQKNVLAKLIDIDVEIKSLHRSEPALSATRIERLETMEDFWRVEQHMGDKQAFETLVQQLSRVGGKDLKDCVHKVLDWLFSNSLMACFNVKGKVKKDKMSVDNTTIYQAIQDAVVKSFTEAMEDAV